MRKLPKRIQRIIKKERFIYDNTKTKQSWKSGMNLKYRITCIKTDSEGYYDDVNPLNPHSYDKINVNITVSGEVESSQNYNSKKMTPIQEAAKYSNGGYNPYDYCWGYSVHKKIRQEIRSVLIDDLKDFLKLIGITGDRHWEPIGINKITWEK